MQVRRKSGLFASLSVVLLFGIAACGVAPHTASSPTGPSTAIASTKTTVKATPVSTTTLPSGGSPTGVVTITVGAPRYATIDTIAVIIDNGSTGPISTADHQTNCKDVSLQREVTGVWQTQRLCLLLTPTRIITLSPGVTPQPLAPGSTPWEAGIYRIAFAYFAGTDSGTDAGGGTGSAASLGQSKSIYSATFTIG